MFSYIVPGILDRLTLNGDARKILTTEFEMHFQCWVGSVQIVKLAYEDNGHRRIRRKLYLAS